MKQQLKYLGFSCYFAYRSRKANLKHNPTPSVTRQSNAPANVLLVAIDALRPDFVPSFDGFSSTHAITPASWTFPAVTSIHTSQYPHEHGSVVHTHPDDEEFARPVQADPSVTLPWVAEAAGYETFGGFAFSQPFLPVEGWYQTHRVYNDANAEKVVNDYQKWRKNRERTFSYLHLSDLHIPVKPPKSYCKSYDVDMSIEDLAGFGYELTRSFDPVDPEAQRFRTHRMRLEAAAFDYVTDCLESLFDDLADDTLVIVTGDHGEALYEHPKIDRQFTDSRPNYGVGHGGTPFDKVARVPLAVSDDHILPTGGNASLVDVAGIISRELVEETLFEGNEWQEPIVPDRIAICEGSRYGAERKAAYAGSKKVIKSQTDNVTLTATIENDDEIFEPIPAETEEKLIETLPSSWDELGSSEQASRVVEDQLKALGYK